MNKVSVMIKMKGQTGHYLNLPLPELTNSAAHILANVIILVLQLEILPVRGLKLRPPVLAGLLVR